VTGNSEVIYLGEKMRLAIYRQLSLGRITSVSPTTLKLANLLAGPDQKPSVDAKPCLCQLMTVSKHRSYIEF
jgi:hypothetical protein